METQIYKVRDPSGNIRQIRGPVGASDSEIIAQAQALFGAEEAPSSEPSLLAQIAANPITRFAMAAGSPVLGAAEWLPGRAGEAVAESNRELRRLIEEGKAGQGDVGQIAGEVAELGGSILSPAFLKLGKMLGPAKTFRGMAAQGAGVGALGGATAPIGEAGLQEKLTSTGAGTVLGGIGTPIVGGLVRGGVNMLAPVVSERAAERGASKIAIKAAGDDAAKIAELLAANRRGVMDETAAQVASPLNRVEFSALQEAWKKRLPSEFVRNLELQEALRKAGVSDLARRTEPAREIPLAEANRMTQAMVSTPQKAATYADEAAQAVEDVRRLTRAGEVAGERAQNLYPVNQMTSQGMSGQPRLAGRYSYAETLVPRAEQAAQEAADRSLRLGAQARVAENLVGSWEQRGLKPLTVDSMIGQLDDIAQKEGNKTNRPLQLAVNGLKRLVQNAATPEGTISAKELYTLRKTGVNEVIDAISQQRSQKVSKQMLEGELIDLKKTIDSMIEKAGGKGWTDYLKDYSKARESIEGPMKRMEQVKEQAPAGTDLVNRLLNEEYKWTSLNLLNPVVTAINAAMRGAEGVAGERVNRAGARLMLPENTQQLGRLMQQNLASPMGILGDVTRFQGGAVSGLTPYYGGLLGIEQE